MELPLLVCLLFLMACSEEKKDGHPDGISSTDVYTSLWDCGEYRTDNSFTHPPSEYWSFNHKKTIEEARQRMRNLPYQDTIFVEGDDESFPLWYLQEVENFRTDLKIVNSSLLDKDWYRDEIRKKGL